MKSTLLKSIVIFLSAVLLYACKGGEIYPIIPSIEFEKSYYISRDSTNLLVFSIKFRDGDGDIGLENGDTLPPYNNIKDPLTGKNTNIYYNNLYVEFLRKEGNSYNYVIADFSGDTLRADMRVMPLTPEGKYKAIRGTIEATLEPSVLLNDGDTVKLRFLLIDRALHLSNTAESGDIIISR
jgi:hypothetical protein